MLPPRLAGYLQYLAELALQPQNRWQGFLLREPETAVDALRYQLAFACYALAVLSSHPDADPEEQERCRAAMAALIDRMIQRRVWSTWALKLEQEGIAPDPIAEANGDYSGQLAMMIGVFEAAGGDQRFDEPFTLFWSRQDRFEYDHSRLVELLWHKLRMSPEPVLETEPQRASIAGLQHVIWALGLHDERHGSDYAALAEKWLHFLEQRIALRGPRWPGRGALRAWYLPRQRRAGGGSIDLLDAWSLAMLAGLYPEAARQFAGRFLDRVQPVQPPADPPQAYAPSGPPWCPPEYRDTALSTGFAYMLAVELDETERASALLNYADAHLEPHNGPEGRCYGGTAAAPLLTALFAIGEAGGLGRLRPLPQR